MSSFIIELHNLRFFNGHGVYKEEQQVGNEFEVNISLQVKAPNEKVTALEQTINYAEVYRITQKIFSVPTPLLETIAMEIAAAISSAFPTLKKISIQIIKLHPPIASFTGSVGITYKKRYR